MDYGDFSKKNMLDVRIFHPYAKNYVNQKLADIYSCYEKEKQRNYLQFEGAPLVYSIHGGMANEAKRSQKKSHT